MSEISKPSGFRMLMINPEATETETESMRASLNSWSVEKTPTERMELEIALLNNDVAALKRELAQKNAEIATQSRAFDVILDENEILNRIVGHRGEEAVLEEEIEKARANRKEGGG